MTSNRFALTTSEVAKLAGIERAKIYASVHANNEWQGVTPRRQLNGRLMWPRAEVLQALGLVQIDRQPPGIRAGAELIERSGQIVTAEAIDLLRALLTTADSKADHGIEADTVFLGELAFAVTETCDRQASVCRAYGAQAARRLRAIAGVLTACADALVGQED